MKIVHAVLEKRNLGRDAWEVTLDRKDLADVPGVIEALHDPRYSGSYVCLKLPVGNLKMVHALEDDGWGFRCGFWISGSASVSAGCFGGIVRL